MVKRYLPICIICSLLLCIVSQCQRFNTKEQLNYKNLIALSDTLLFYKNRLGTQTASIQTLQLEQKQMENALIKKDKDLAVLAKEFNQIKSVTKYKTITRFDTILIPFDDPLDSLPRFERFGNHTNQWYSLSYKVTNDSLTISDFTANTETTIITGLKRKWFLGEQTLITDITNSNPYITVSGLKSAEVVIHRPWYDKWYIWLASGLTAGFILK